MTSPYAPFDALELVDAPEREACWRIFKDNEELVREAMGSSHNHQAWPGGYVDHVNEVMLIALRLYDTLNAIRTLPFTKHDALLVLYLHDIEKPWKKVRNLWSKAGRKAFREEKIKAYGITLTPTQANALQYVEGEGDDYRGDRRVMNELAAFCHACDVLSARLWHDQPGREAAR